MTTTSTGRLAEPLRRQAIREIRKNLKFVFLEGGSQEYSCTALAGTINQIAGTTFGKNTIRKFFLWNQEIKGPEPTDRQIADLLVWTRTEQKKVENILSGALNAVVVSAHIAPDLQGDFRSVVDRLSLLSSEQMKQVTEFIRTLE